MLELTVLSTAFLMNAAIPPKYTCKGQNMSPPLTWNQVPTNTQSIAVICEDPDSVGGTPFTHWLLFNLPPDTQRLAEGFPKLEELPNGAMQGPSDFGRTGYMGPCPPPGKPHRYVFTVYALDSKLHVFPGASKEDVQKAMKGHVVAKGQLIGIFQR